MSDRVGSRYAQAVHARSLRHSRESMASGTDPARTATPVDVLGAAGLAAKHSPLAMSLARLISGDNRAVRDVVGQLATMADSKAPHLQVEVTRAECEDLGRAVLAWLRSGTCRPCGGLGREREQGAPVLSNRICRACRGTGRMPFDSQFPMLLLPLARWLRDRAERDLAKAGAVVMQHLAERMP